MYTYMIFIDLWKIQIYAKLRKIERGKLKGLIMATDSQINN